MNSSNMGMPGYKDIGLPIILAVISFGVDLTVPLGVAIGVIYVLPILSTLPRYNEHLTLGITITTATLILIGWILSPEGGELKAVAANRILSLLVVAVAYWTVRKAVEFNSRVRESEKQNRQLIEAAPSGMIMIDHEGTIVLANALITELFGYARDSLLGQSIETLTPERFRGQDRGHRTTFFATPEPRSMGTGRDLYGLRQDGTEFPVEIGLNPLTTDDGTFVLASVVDITSRKQAEERIAAQTMDLQKHTKSIEQLLRQNELLLNSAGEGIWGLDLEGKTTFVNPSAAQMLGFAREELIGTLMHQLIHHTKPNGSPYPREDCPMYAAYIKGSVQHVEDEVLWRKDGSSFPVAYISTPIREEDGRVTGAVVTFRDITEQKQHQNELKLVTERLQIATQSAQIGVWDWDVQNNVLTWDEQMYALYGVTPDTFPGAYEAWTTSLHPDDHDQSHGALQEALAGGAPFNTDFRIIWPDRSIHHVRAFAVINRNQAGEAIRMTGVNWDITNEKMTADAIAEHVQNLQRSNADLEQFAHVVSHDLKAPLRGISSVSRWLLQDLGPSVSPDSKENLELMLERTLRMDDLINGILAYSKAGTETQAPTPVDLHRLVHQIIGELQPPESLEIRIEGTLPHVRGDETQFRQIFQNLLNNAIQHFGKPSGEIVVACRDEKSTYIFTVHDTGIGIPKTQYDKIFGLFQTLKSKDAGAGTGVGLAIVKKIVERHGGKITVTSKEGDGSTFTIILPKTLHNVNQAGGAT
ncbi:MAG: PAS domain-containing sensor histidine kinase [Nitrospirales bacterium]